jgi:hypothetical protein
MELAELRSEPAPRAVQALDAGDDEPTDRGAAVRSVALNRHVLPFALALLAGALFVPVPVHGVTLGNVASLSPLGHPLRIVIPIALSTGETLNIACVKLVADNSASSMPQIVTGRVTLEQGKNGPRLVIASPASFSEPALRLAVQVGCGSTTRRDYVLFLDPPNSESPSEVADADEASWTRVTRESLAVVSATPRQSIVVTSPLPPTTWGVPYPTPPGVAEARPKPLEKIAPEPKVELPVVAAAPAPRELTTVSSGVGFISEAGASSLPSGASAVKAMSGQSYPLSGQGSWRSQPPPPTVSVWQLMWPYAMVIFATMGLALVASILYRRHSVKTSWMDPKSRESLKGETQAGVAQTTYAHFGGMTVAAKVKPKSRAPLKLPPEEPAPDVNELDTLLHDIQSDMIDERSVKEAWKSAAGDSPMDLGSDSILKAIAAAERDLQIGAPEPSQVALDHALDNDLMTVPNVPKKAR